MLSLLHRFASVAASNRAAYGGDVGVWDMGVSASVEISTFNGLVTVLSKMKATFATVVQVQRRNFDQRCGVARAMRRHHLHTHNSSRGTFL